MFNVGGEQENELEKTFDNRTGNKRICFRVSITIASGRFGWHRSWVSRRIRRLRIWRLSLRVRIRRLPLRVRILPAAILLAGSLRWAKLLLVPRASRLLLAPSSLPSPLLSRGERLGFLKSWPDADSGQLTFLADPHAVNDWESLRLPV